VQTFEPEMPPAPPELMAKLTVPVGVCGLASPLASATCAVHWKYSLANPVFSSLQLTCVAEESSAGGGGGSGQAG
jgi:hypothetical protein